MWLIDAGGTIVYISPAMRTWLGMGDELPDPIADVLTLDRELFWSGGFRRGHLTRRLHLPPRVTGDPESAAHGVTAHYVALPSWPTAATDAAESSLILGCLGDFLADADVPWEDWFGERGVRETAKLDDELARYRGQEQRRANLIMAGVSSPSRRFRASIELACRIRCHVGLMGPAGCGAAEIASLIHHASAPGEPLVCLDASLMDAELLEVYASPAIAELREHTDTVVTLCLDRLDEMPGDAQSRLVEWLETWPQRLRLLGIFRADAHTDQESLPLDATLVDAMSVYLIHFPTLASRREDLELMATGSVRSARFSREAIELIQLYPWPGEWDEFTTSLQFAAEVVTGDRIGREHLPLAIRSYRPSQQRTSLVTSDGGEITIAPHQPAPQDFQIDSLDEALSQYESKLIEQAMAAAQGNKAEAARRLGISRTRLLRKLAGDPPS